MPNNEAKLWHYTNLEGLKGILSKKNLWATDYQFLNDYSELTYSKSILHQELLPNAIDRIQKYYNGSPYIRNLINAQANGSIEEFSKRFLEDAIEGIVYEAILKPEPLQYTPCLLSFCNSPDDDFIKSNGLLSQWRGYGREGGFAIIFNKNKLCADFEVEANKYHYAACGHGDAEYETTLQNMRDKLKANFNILSEHVFEIMDYVLHIKEGITPAASDTLQYICDFVVFLKHRGFKEEQEYRFYAFVSSKDEKSMDLLQKEKGKVFKEINFINRSGTLVPYINLFEWEDQMPVEAICVGPHKNQKLNERAIKAFLNSIGQNHVEVFCSVIPYIG